MESAKHKRGRPPNPAGATKRAPILYLRLDAETEGALAALRVSYRGAADPSPDTDIARDAIVAHAHERCGESATGAAITAAQIARSQMDKIQAQRAIFQQLWRKKSITK